MKIKFTKGAVALSVILLFFTGPSIYGRGHGGGNSGTSGMSAARGSYGGAVSRGYAGGGFRSAGSYGARSYSSYRSTGRHGYGSYPAVRSGTGQSQISRSYHSSRNSVYRNQSGIPHATRVARVHHSGQASHQNGLHQDGTRLTNRHPAGVRETGHGKNWSQRNATNRNRLDHHTADGLRNGHGRTPGLAEARRNHQDNHNHHHNHDWWRHHCGTIVLVDWGYWGWDEGWWYPAWGYNPYYSYYAYDGPIYGYDGLPPDQVIANLQGALQREGYYPYAVDGVLGPATQTALERYQQDHGLSVTGAVDPQTLTSLGFIT